MKAEDIARALGGKRSGRQWLCRCPVHDDRNPSLLVFDGHTRVQFRCLAGCRPFEVISALRTRGFFRNSNSWAKFLTTAHSSRPKANLNANLKRALSIWKEAVDPLCTLAETYLLHRYLELPPEMAMSVVRFHPRCPRGNERHPAVLIAMHDIGTFEFTAIQRLFLDPAKPLGKEMKFDTRMLGPVAHAAMLLSSRSDTFSVDQSYCPRLFVTEGFETALALRRQGYQPIWALGSAGAMARFPVLPNVGELVICADNDRARRLRNGRIVQPGIDAALECFFRWDSGGRKVDYWTPDGVGLDFADLAGGWYGGKNSAT